MAWRKRRAQAALNTGPDIGCFGIFAALVGGVLLGVGLIGLLILLAEIIY